MPLGSGKWLAAAMTLFARNWITLLGSIITTVAAVLLGGFLVMGFFVMTDSPYLGIMAFMVLPAVFVGGLLIIPIGAYWETFKEHRRKRLGMPEVPLPTLPFPVLDFNNQHIRRVTAIVAALTIINVIILVAVTYQGVVYMDSVPFCGQTCHTVMQPEFVAYSNSPHSRVECVECHIGPGAPWFVKSKMSGLSQVLAVTFNTYPKPIPTPVENLRPSRDTCEQCHWPEKFTGDRLKVIPKYQDDESNTKATTVIQMHIGGGHSQKGIHSWHISPDHKHTYYAVDKQRQKIAKVRVDKGDGTSVTYQAPKDKYTPDELAHAEERVMDCIDCHNRPTHIFKLPAQAVDESMAAGRIDTTLPFIKKTAVDVLTEAKGTHGDLDQIDKAIHAFYQEKYADLATSGKDRIDAAVKEVQAIYSRNVFPDMDVTWGVHPNNLGHEQSPGCFRCHDDSMQTEDGKSIGQDCTTCHNVLAWDETDPETLSKLGVE